MKRIATIALSSVLALSLVACGATQGVESGSASEGSAAQEVVVGQAEEGEYTYEGIESWDVPQESMNGMTQLDMMTYMAKPGTDMDAFVHSELGEFALGSFGLMQYGTIDNPDLAEYWAGLGMVHEAHDVEDEDHQWTSLVPENLEEGKTYPLLFVWHGNDNPLLLAEGYGFGEEAAERGWIVVYPWANNDDDYLEEFDRILAQMEEEYPVDTSRIYTTGFSKGGRISAHLALERADVLAAAAPNGTTAAASFYNPDGSDIGLTGPGQLTESDFEAATAFTPIQFFGGEFDVFGAMPYDEDYKVDGVNGWLGLMGNANTQTLGEAGPSETEQAIGLTFDETSEAEEDGTTYHIGSYLDADGNAAFRIVECDGAIHWPTRYMSELDMDFMQQFSK